MILQLRSPKLSNGYRPTTLMNILNNVLQPLLEEDLKPLSEAIEEMNKTKEHVDLLEKHAKYLANYIKTYRNYNETLLYNKAKNYLMSHKKTTILKQKIEDLNEQIENYQKQLKMYEDELNQKNQIIEQAKVRKSHINENDITNKVEKSEKLRVEITSNKKSLENIKLRLNSEIENENQLIVEITNLKNEISKLETAIDDVIIDIHDLSDDMYFNEIYLAISSLEKDKTVKLDYDNIKNSLKKYQNRVEKVKEKMLKVEELDKVLDEHLQEYEILNREYHEIEKNIVNLENEIRNAIDDFKDNFNKQLLQNQFLKLSSDEIRVIFDYLNHYNHDNYLKAKNKYWEIGNKIKSNLLESKCQLEYKLTIQEQEKNRLLSQKQELENKKEIELAYDYDNQLQNLLEENKITYLPFYKAITFKDNVSLEEKNALESALLNSHILDSKVILTKDRTKIKHLKTLGTFVYKTTKKDNNLTKYLKLQLEENSEFKKQDIIDVLESISVDLTQEIAVAPDGYKMDFLEGNVDSNYQTKYIGVIARQEERRRKILEIEKEISSAESIILNIKGFVNDICDQIKVLENEQQTFPNDDELNNLESKQLHLEKDLDYINNRQKSIETKINKCNKEKDLIKRDISLLKEDLMIPLNVEKYSETLNVISIVFNELNTLENDCKLYEMKNDLLLNKEIMKESSNNSISYLQADLGEKERIINLSENELHTIEELLQKDDYKSLVEELKKIEEILSTVPVLKEGLTRKITQAEDKIEELTAKLCDYQQQQEINQVFDRTYEYLFKREYNLHYVYEEEMEDVLKLSSKILKDLKDKENSNVTGVVTLYYKAYNDYSLMLNDYNLTDIAIFENDDIASTLVKNHEELLDDIENILKENVRRDIVATYEGRKVNLIKLAINIDQAVLDTKDIINEQDRHLFEDILLKTVGEKIRNRIEESEKWVAKINNIMDIMQRDSALSFKLVWKSKTSDDDNEIDTKEIVRILKIDPTIATTNDINKLMNHFRSKIKKAEILNEDNYVSYYNIIFDVLDYRNWFYFQMYYKQGNQERKELTDKVFSRFSGGEKAKTMYIPMFASVYSKLGSARCDAIRIVALDEAFAGVDDENIRELLGIMIHLNLDFIMTSQVLWCDYDVVPLLSICELLADKSTETVAVRRYKWNGTSKVIVTDRYNEN